MNNFVLRGFCQTCGFPVYLNEEKAYHTTNANTPLCMGLYGHCRKIKPVWFLSPKQMKIVWEDDRSRAWMFERLNKQHRASAHFLLYYILDENPFLVAKILKNAGEKSKEENK